MINKQLEESKMKTSIKKTLASIVFVGALTLGVIGCDGPRIEEVKDFTGDGIIDVMLNVSAIDNSVTGRFLFISQKDGNYIRAREYRGEVKYFKTEQDVIYIFDGEFYKPLPKQE